MKKLLTLTAAAAVLLAGTACEPVEEKAPPVQGGKGKTSGTPSKKAKPPIGLAAKRTTAKRSVLDDGGALTCVKVTVTNNSKKKVEVNPLYFAITGTDGVKHGTDEALGNYEGQIETMDIAPREKASGVVCADGKFTPKTVSMTDPGLSTAARAQVA